jgi:hypothetical protein
VSAWLRRLAILLAGGILAGCSIGPELRRHLGVVDNAWRGYRDATVPASGQDEAGVAALASSMDDAIATARRAAEAE